MSQFKETVCRLWRTHDCHKLDKYWYYPFSHYKHKPIAVFFFPSAHNVLSKDASPAPVRSLTGAEDYERRVTDGTGRLVRSTVNELRVRIGSARIAAFPLCCPARW